MNTVNQLIDRSALPLEVKAELKLLSKRLLICIEEAKTLESDIFKIRAGFDEHLFSERICEVMSEKERDSVVLNQIGYRNWFTNAVLRSHENNRQGDNLSRLIREKCQAIGMQADAPTNAALMVLLVISDIGAERPNQVLVELDKVRGITRKRLEENVRIIFRQKRGGAGPCARKNFSAQPIDVFEPSPEQAELVRASQAAIEIFHAYRPSAEQYVSAKMKLNRPQFTERLEVALAEGDMDKFEQIKREQKNAEDALFVAATGLRVAVEIFKTDTDRFREVIVKAARVINDDPFDDLSLKSLIEMSNCIAAWHWHHEMHLWLQAYDSYNLPEVLNDLYIDMTLARTIGKSR